jgi:hypothetical protein
LVKSQAKNARFEAVAEWAKPSLHESLVSISMIDNVLFEKYHFQAWKVRSTLCIMCLGCKIRGLFSTWHLGFSSGVEESLAFFKFPVWV